MTPTQTLAQLRGLSIYRQLVEPNVAAIGRISELRARDEGVLGVAVGESGRVASNARVQESLGDWADRIDGTPDELEVLADQLDQIANVLESEAAVAAGPLEQRLKGPLVRARTVQTGVLAEGMRALGFGDEKAPAASGIARFGAADRARIRDKVARPVLEAGLLHALAAVLRQVAERGRRHAEALAELRGRFARAIARLNVPMPDEPAGRLPTDWSLDGPEVVEALFRKGAHRTLEQFIIDMGLADDPTMAADDKAVDAYLQDYVAITVRTLVPAGGPWDVVGAVHGEDGDAEIAMRTREMREFFPFERPRRRGPQGLTGKRVAFVMAREDARPLALRVKASLEILTRNPVEIITGTLDDDQAVVVLRGLTKQPLLNAHNHLVGLARLAAKDDKAQLSEKYPFALVRDTVHPVPDALPLWSWLREFRRMLRVGRDVFDIGETFDPASRHGLLRAAVVAERELAHEAAVEVEDVDDEPTEAVAK